MTNFQIGELVFYIHSDYDSPDLIKAGRIDFRYKDGRLRLKTNWRGLSVTPTEIFRTASEAGVYLLEMYAQSVPVLIRDAEAEMEELKNANANA